MPEINKKDFEFFTFLTGLEKKELYLIEKLVNSFPYKGTHKLNIIDKTNILKKNFSKKKKIYYSDRHYLVKQKLDFEFKKWKQMIDKNSKIINIIKEKKFYNHPKSIQNIFDIYAKKKFIVILDSDTVFKNNKYLNEIIKKIKKIPKKYQKDIGAIGTIHQEAPFSLPLKKFFSHEFYKLFVKDNRINTFSILKSLLKNLFKSKNLKSNRIHKLPRLWTSLLTLNKKIIKDEKIFSKYLWLEVFDFSNSKNMMPHRIMGDSGASILFGLGMAGKKIVNIDCDDFIHHERSGSRNKKIKQIDKSWLRFDY
jgi:hypothetical protein